MAKNDRFAAPGAKDENAVDAPKADEIHGVPVEDLGNDSAETPRVASKESAQRDADADPNRAAPGVPGEFAADFEVVDTTPRVPEEPRLPVSAYKSEAFSVANNAARDAFENAVIFPGFIFNSPGRYHNIENLDDVYDVLPGMKVPDGLYLIGDNYLLAGADRETARKRHRNA